MLHKKLVFINNYLICELYSQSRRALLSLCVKRKFSGNRLFHTHPFIPITCVLWKDLKFCTSLCPGVHATPVVPWVCSGSGCNTVFLQFLACPKISGAVSVCLRSYSRVIYCFLWSRVDSLYLPILEGLQTLKYKKYTIILCPYIVSLKTQFAYQRYLFCLFMEILW